MDFSGNDELGRAKFADLLAGYIANLAAASLLPAARVIAVDAPWGSGKSWVATRLPGHFAQDRRIGACIYLDAFHYDYHQDPFAVIASAILDTFKDRSTEAASFASAAAEVLKNSLPAIGKGVIKVGGKALGVDTESITQSLLDAAGDSSDKAIEALLSTYSTTRASTSAFQKKLSELAATCNNGPLVIIIDELDRCRPSFALELLERVKHLFDVQNVVFLFFVHTPALHSAVHHMYGQGIDAHKYLRKFFTISIGLPNSAKSTTEKSGQTRFFSRFIHARYATSTSSQEFVEAVAQFAPFFHAGFREIENVVFIWQMIDGTRNYPITEAAYGLFLRLVDPVQFLKLRNRLPDAYAFEIERLSPQESNEGGHTTWMRDIFLAGADPNTFRLKASLSPQRTQNIDEYKTGLADFGRVLDRLVLEHIHIG